MGNYYVDRILEEKKITDFLQESGIYPVKKSGDKYIYRCPVHSGDNDPSFVVYPVGTKGRSYQTYYCFGCHSGINIINLKSDLDSMTVRESVNFFLKDINVDPIEVTDSIIDSIVGSSSETASQAENDHRIEVLLLEMNTKCRNYLVECGDNEEVEFFENNFYKKIDEIARAKDVDTLDAYSNMLIDKDVLVIRTLALQKRKEDEGTSASDWIL